MNINMNNAFWFRIKACWLLLTSNRCAVFAFSKPGAGVDSQQYEYQALATSDLLVSDVAAVQAWVKQTPAATLRGLQLLADTQALLDELEPLAAAKASSVSKRLEELPENQTGARNTPRRAARSFGVYVRGNR